MPSFLFLFAIYMDPEWLPEQWYMQCNIIIYRIDHWDNEREKMIVLCDWSLLVIKYDFITQKLKDFRRLLLHMIHQIHIGDFQYPEKSLMK